MKLKDFENGIHNWEDLNKKFHHTWVYASVKKEIPTVIRIHEILPEEVVFLDKYHDDFVTAPIDSFNLIQPRPSMGLVNFEGLSALTKPVRILKRPRRQWRVGACDDNLSITDVRNTPIVIKTGVNWVNLEKMFVPTYYTFDEAIKLLVEGKTKHIAINPKISLMRGNGRFILFKNFVPIFAYSKGLVFKIIPHQEFVEEDYDKYYNLFKQTV